MSVKTIFRKGDRVRATCEGRTVTAIVTLASKNGRSLVIDWTHTDDHMLTGHVGRMPIFCRYEDDVFHALLDGAVVELERLPIDTSDIPEAGEDWFKRAKLKEPK